MNTKKILPFLALMITMAGPFAYADGRNNDKGASASNSQPATQYNAQSESTSNGQSPCSAQDPKQDKQKDNSAPSDQEREFERVLMGIYG